MKHARRVVGPSTVLAGNLDPMILYGRPQNIESAVKQCIMEAGIEGRHVLNLGHGVELDTPEDAVRCVVEAARKYSMVHK